MNIVEVIINLIPQFFTDSVTVIITCTPQWVGTTLMFMVGFAFMGMMFTFIGKHKQDMGNGR